MANIIVKAGGLALLALGVCASNLGGVARADDMAETEIFTISRGGQIYDNWMSALEADKPTETHPAYPAEGKQSGAGTWRCKECHGWDYLGAEGGYSTGSHFTGIKGVRGMAGGDPAAVKAIVRDGTHGYTPAMISDTALDKLALFVTAGQIDMDQYVDRATKIARGDPANGARLYQTVCAICHGFDGKELNFASAEDPEYIGTLAADNPWEGLHKIRNGQPGIPMVAMAGFNIQEQVDILAYIQTLPVK